MDGRDRRLLGLAESITSCTACPRLVAARRDVATDGSYWARPVPGFGDPRAGVYILGLATAPHGGNRTGRAFTGNRSANTLVTAMYRSGLASQPESRHVGDGLSLHGAWMASAVRCPPPDHRPTPAERDTCLPWLTAEMRLLADVRVMICLGRFAWEAAARWAELRPRPRFAHGAEQVLGGRVCPGLLLLGCFHPSPQNTQTGRLTPGMLDDILRRARDLSGLPPVA